MPALHAAAGTMYRSVAGEPNMRPQTDALDRRRPGAGAVDTAGNVRFARKIEMKGDASNAAEANHAYYVEGCRFFDAGHFARAASAFKKALECWPEDGKAWMALGNCHDRLKKPKRAEECFRNALQFSPPEDRDKVLFNLGNSLYDQSRLDEALKIYEQVGRGTEIWRKSQRNIDLIRQRQLE